MQGYTYSIFSAVAIVIHLIINFDLIRGRVEASMRGSRYRSFLIGVLVYYVADAAWGVFAGLGWTRALYVDTKNSALQLSLQLSPPRPRCRRLAGEPLGAEGVSEEGRGRFG